MHFSPSFPLREVERRASKSAPGRPTSESTPTVDGAHTAAASRASNPCASDIARLKSGIDGRNRPWHLSRNRGLGREADDASRIPPENDHIRAAGARHCQPQTGGCQPSPPPQPQHQGRRLTG